MRLHLSRPFCLPAELDGYRSGEAAESANSELECEDGVKGRGTGRRGCFRILSAAFSLVDVT